MEISDFVIEKLDDGNFVVKAKGIYQDIDFVNGGNIPSHTRAEEIRDLMIEQMNAPIVEPISNEQRIKELEETVAMLMLGGAL